MSKITTYAQLKEKKKPVTKKVFIALDHDRADSFNTVASEYRDLEDQLAEHPSDKALRGQFNIAKEKYDAALAESEDFVVEFVIRSIGRKKFEQITSDSPPTEKQKKEAMKAGEEEPAWDPETFMPTLLAEAVVTPEISLEEMFELWEDDSWNMAELLALFMAALQVNQTRKIVDLGKEFGQTPDYDLS